MKCSFGVKLFFYLLFDLPKVGCVRQWVGAQSTFTRTSWQGGDRGPQCRLAEEMQTLSVRIARSPDIHIPIMQQTTKSSITKPLLDPASLYWELVAVRQTSVRPPLQRSASLLTNRLSSVRWPDCQLVLTERGHCLVMTAQAIFLSFPDWEMTGAIYHNL